MHSLGQTPLPPPAEEASPFSSPQRSRSRSRGHSVDPSPRNSSSSERVGNAAGHIFSSLSSLENEESKDLKLFHSYSLLMDLSLGSERIGTAIDCTSFEDLKEFGPNFLSHVTFLAKTLGIKEEKVFFELKSLKEQGFSETFIQRTFSDGIERYAKAYEVILRWKFL